jgi:hypothetical protein
VATVDDSQFPGVFPGRIFRADIAASLATVAQLGEYQDFFAEHRKCIESADFRTLAASAAAIRVDIRHEGEDRGAGLKFGADDEMGVRLLDIAIEELDLPIDIDCQIG